MSFGLALAIVGMLINIHSDEILIRLRDPKKDEGKIVYRIPEGGWFNSVSCANYFGECLEWLGVFVSFPCAATGVFFLDTCLYLFPRAWAYDRWYRVKFGKDWPEHRKIIVPGVW